MMSQKVETLQSSRIFPVLTKEFHDIVLGNGAMPLNILEQVVNDWISARRNR